MSNQEQNQNQEQKQMSNQNEIIKVKTKRSKSKTHKKSSNFIFWIVRGILRPVLKRKYNCRISKSHYKSLKRPCLIMCNHQAGFDQFSTGIIANFGINFVASDTIFRHGFKSWIMKKLANPIPITKGMADITAVKKMMQVTKNGGAVGIFPEGNRCFF
ncbi:MAG: 1-acyl-sn-glycerol-3-phosphate acyltransferase, partial [Firmicutes bacterium]|nr:1-acyl-sn-glycerol-3-phosphate acyltransferase [Bacillota bacterium]